MKVAVMGLLLGLLVSAQVAAQTRHMYINGIVQAVSEEGLTLGGEVFVLQPNARVIVQRWRDGAFHEGKGRLSDVAAGHSATVRVTGKVISEIIVEKWKQ